MATALPHHPECEPVVENENEVESSETSPCDLTAEGPSGKDLLLSQHSKTRSDEKSDPQYTSVSQNPFSKTNEQPEPLDQDPDFEPVLSGQELKNVAVLASPSEGTVGGGIATSVSTAEMALLAAAPAQTAFCVNAGHDSGTLMVTGLQGWSEPAGQAKYREQGDHNVPRGQPKPLHGAALYGLRERQEAVPHEELVAAAVGDNRRVLECRLQIVIRDDDDDGPVVDLRRAQELRGARQLQDHQSACCCSCRYEKPEISVLPCGHCILCPQCFLDPYSYHAVYDGFPCPVCTKKTNALKFSEKMKQILYRRNARQ